MRTPQQAIAHDHTLYELLYVARQDLSQAAFFAAHLLKKGWHFEPWERRWSTYLQQSAYTTALVVAYARPFTESRGWPNFPKRLIPYDQIQNDFHGKVLALRNMTYAHSNLEAREIRPFKIDGQPSAIERLPSMRFTKEDLELLLSMISSTNAAIQKRLVQLIEVVPNGT